MKDASGSDTAVDAAFAAVLRAEAEALREIEATRADAAGLVDAARRACTRIEQRNSERLARWLAALELRAQQAVLDCQRDPPDVELTDPATLQVAVDVVAAQLTGAAA